MKNNKFIHLLYVPTMACNMACKYCYLEENTKDEFKNLNSLDTLEYAIKKFKESNVIPFNISLHGGEVTTLSHDEFYKLIKYIKDYYNENRKIITSAGFKIGVPHIKTNLYDIDKHIDTIRKFNVSISGSLDLPLSLHDEYRLTKGNKKTLEKIFANVKLLEDIPNKKKISSTIFKEHYEYIDEIYMRKHLINEVCDYPENNSLYIMLLSGNLVTYGDENRTKQRHISTQQIYKGVLDDRNSNISEYYKYDISNFIKEYKNLYATVKPNNIFFTTSALRDYHYIKQKNNAYYHIQAINLPFQNIEFYYIDEELK